MLLKCFFTTFSPLRKVLSVRYVLCVNCHLFIAYDMKRCKMSNGECLLKRSKQLCRNAADALLLCGLWLFAVRFMAFCRVKGRLSVCVWPRFGLVMSVILPCDGRHLPFLSPLQLHMLTAFSINVLCSRRLCLHTFSGLISVRCAIILRQRPSLHSSEIIV